MGCEIHRACGRLGEKLLRPKEKEKQGRHLRKGRRYQQAGQGLANVGQDKTRARHCLKEPVLAFFLRASTDLAEGHHRRFPHG